MNRLSAVILLVWLKDFLLAKSRKIDIIGRWFAIKYWLCIFSYICDWVVCVIWGDLLLSLRERKKLTSLDFGADCGSLSLLSIFLLGIEELKIGVVEPNWSQQQERIACLNDKYLDILDPVQM